MQTLAIADDHIPTLRRFSSLLKEIHGYNIISEAENGHDLIIQVTNLKNLPDLILVDINMPVIDGVTVAYYLKSHYPEIKLIALSNFSDETSVQKMVLSGADGFVMKALAENVIKNAIDQVMSGTLYIDPRMEIDEERVMYLVKSQKEKMDMSIKFGLTSQERTFLILNATMLTYEQIASTMFVDHSTVQNYYDNVSQKLKISDRYGLKLFALQHGLATVAEYN